MNTKIIKFVGLFATGIGFLADLASDWADEREIEDMVDRKIAEALGNNVVKATHNTKHKKGGPRR